MPTRLIKKGAYMDIYLILAGYFFCRGVEAGEAEHPAACGCMIVLSILTGALWFLTRGTATIPTF
jgi:hypothetical protein